MPAPRRKTQQRGKRAARRPKTWVPLLELGRRRRGRVRTDAQRAHDAYLALLFEEAAERLKARGMRSPRKQAMTVLAQASDRPVKTLEAAIARANREARLAAERAIGRALARAELDT